jgi:hypothetical protein
MDWARILAYVTGTVDQELLARNEYLATENRILKDQLKGRLMLSDAERATLGEIGHRLGRKVLTWSQPGQGPGRIGLFQGLLNPLHMARLLARKLLAGTPQRPQVAGSPVQERSSP